MLQNGEHLLSRQRYTRLIVSCQVTREVTEGVHTYTHKHIHTYTHIHSPTVISSIGILNMCVWNAMTSWETGTDRPDDRCPTGRAHVVSCHLLEGLARVRTSTHRQPNKPTSAFWASCLCNKHMDTKKGQHRGSARDGTTCFCVVRHYLFCAWHPPRSRLTSRDLENTKAKNERSEN